MALESLATERSFAWNRFVAERDTPARNRQGMEREVKPELLDQLSPEDPRAIHSRRDLKRINFWMGNVGHIARTLKRVTHAPKEILEVGCGDGSLSAALARKFAHQWAGVRLTLLDMTPAIPTQTVDQIRATGWEMEIMQADLRLWAKRAPERQYDCIIANLFMHHFQNAELADFFRVFAERTQLFVACDPRRWRVSLMSVPLLRLLGCNDVTLHDARISIIAGFCGKELTEFWPADSGFHIEEREEGFSSHLFAAYRKGAIA